MSLSSLHEAGLVAVAKQEQGLAWLIGHGPLVPGPPFDGWLLRNLVREERILRLRRDLYLAPLPDGDLPSLAWTIGAVDPRGHITGHAALALHGLNDQAIAWWRSVSPVRQADLRYGPFTVHFICSAPRAATGRTEVLDVGTARVRVASVAQAFVDELRFDPARLDWVATARVLQNALDARVISESAVLDILVHDPSVAVARRAGFLFEIIRGRPDAHLLALGRSNHDRTVAGEAKATDATWRLSLPISRQAIERAVR